MFQGSKRTGILFFSLIDGGQDWSLGSERGLLTVWRSPGSAAAVSPASLAVGERMEVSPQGIPKEKTS